MGGRRLEGHNTDPGNKWIEETNRRQRRMGRLLRKVRVQKEL